MRNKKKLLVDQLDAKLIPFRDTRSVIVPDRGWINAIRTTLNMTMAQLGKKLGITRQGVRAIETNEVNGSISLNSLSEVAGALDMQLVYALVPKNGTIDGLIATEAQRLARKIVLRTHQNMQLENQGIGNEKINESINDVAEEIKREVRRSLWD